MSEAEEEGRGEGGGKEGRGRKDGREEKAIFWVHKRKPSDFLLPVWTRAYKSLNPTRAQDHEFQLSCTHNTILVQQLKQLHTTLPLPNYNGTSDTLNSGTSNKGHSKWWNL